MSGLAIADLLPTLAIFFIATTVRATFGFGDALIAMPLLTLSLGITTATPLFALVAITVTASIVVTSWDQIEFASVRQLVVSSVVGVPFGVVLIDKVPEIWIMRGLGLFLLGFGLIQLTGVTLPRLHKASWSYPFGFVAGILGSAYNISGPPIVTYGVMQDWSPQQFRATLQGFFLPTGLAVVTGHAIGGLWTVAIFQNYVLALPVTLVATACGTAISHRIPTKRFEFGLYLLLLVLGVWLLAA